MQIKIKDRFKVISHDIDVSFLILNTSYFVKIYPGFLFFQDLISNKNFKIFLKFDGYVKNFTVLQNLHNRNIEVNFHTKDGYAAYKIIVKEKNAYLVFDKITIENFTYEFDKTAKISFKEELRLPITTISQSSPQEFLSFGIYKKPDLYQIKKRENLQELLPFIFLYSQFYSDIQINCSLDKRSLLKEIEEFLQKKDKLNLNEAFIKAIKIHFFGAFIPRKNDEEYQNISNYFDNEINPFCVFKIFNESIKAILVEQQQKILFLLPSLPSHFNHGRAVNIKIPSGHIDIEWSKKLIKKAVFRPSKQIDLKLVLQSSLKTFRLRTDKYEKGCVYHNQDVIAFEKEKVYFLDNFRK